MASHSNQYIFGEFSPDEFNQFFVTPRCYVELPPFNDKVSCISHSSGEDYQHIEFGVDEVINAEPVAVRDSLYKVSSTLNPQAPEFILGCQSSPKAFPTATPVADIPDGADFNSLCCDDSETSVHQSCSDMDGVSGGLGQRKKKKKRPPGYYNYLEGSNSTGLGTDGVGASGLVNGHTLNASLLGSEDMMGDMLAEAELIPPNSVTSTPQTAPLSHQRTCESPDNSTLDLTSGAASLSDRNGAASLSTSSSSSSQSSGVAQVGRTAEQHADPPALESPVLLGNGGHSSSPPSPLPPAAALATPTTTIPATTDQREAEGSGEANGLPETASASGAADELQDSSEMGEVQSSSSVTPLSLDSEVQPVVSPVPPAAPVANPPKSWASLFHNSKPLPGGPQAYVEVKSVPAVVEITPAVSELPEKANEVHEGPVPVSEDPMAPKLAELIENVKLIHKPVSLQPRGLINKGNWCYINATLQALIACPPMYHLMKSIPLFSETQRPCTSTPMMDNFVRLVNEFSNMPVPSKAKQQAAGEKIMKDLRVGVAFEPTYIYKLLTLIKSSLSEKGRQEDAEEYLGFILNGLHEEMLALKKLISPQEEKAPTPNGPESQPGVEEDPAEKEEGSDDEWEQVGPRNKTSITRQADFIRTPITDIFGGHIRSVVYQQSSKESATLQPFFTLQLDIQSEKIRTVQEALEILVARESVQGYTTKSKQEIEISRRVTLEELPPVLVLHLKRFVFEKTGGCQKLVKNIDYPVDLEISKDLLSPGVRGKTFKGQRTYRLFAVVYHHGNSATGGHYTTDVFHIGLNGWLRIDDQAVKIINQHQVVKQTAERTAYLLYYRRLDLL
ncbi:ubiquitin carboxyl-terminal hydrolase 10 isoform X4 [Rhinichthys klamathensis goyatoka]|uniref:ubiquitin carboxyl-terminal hydrolase 10 isoform X4 n=1 Tax=Rhinichthys klamathensis goyatoka TaxID=3034132 RepID=UPI0024B5F158|nr:ubiquitin carboxyl-terminal hydrolase 10 isoform X4 [Rhinichthys klamathensis goyatoka]